MTTEDEVPPLEPLELAPFPALPYELLLAPVDVVTAPPFDAVEVLPEPTIEMAPEPEVVLEKEEVPLA